MAEPEVTDLFRWRSPICGFLRKSSVFCGFPAPSKCLNFQEKGWICENLRFGLSLCHLTIRNEIITYYILKKKSCKKGITLQQLILKLPTGTNCNCNLIIRAFHKFKYVVRTLCRIFLRREGERVRARERERERGNKKTNSVSWNRDAQNTGFSRDTLHFAQRPLATRCSKCWIF